MSKPYWSTVTVGRPNTTQIFESDFGIVEVVEPWATPFFSQQPRQPCRATPHSWIEDELK